MKNKTPLALMEQLAMVLVFALAATVCLQAFVLSDRISRTCEARDHAVLAAQNAAETLKAAGGDIAHAQESARTKLGGTLSQGIWYVCYDANWNVTEDDGSGIYRLMAQGRPADVEGLCQAHIWVCAEKDGEQLFSLEVAWQEVDGDA